MGDAELSLIRFGVMNFFAVLLNSRPFQPISTLLMKLCEALTLVQDPPNQKIKDRLKFIYENTNKEVGVHLSIVELVVFRNLDRGVMKEIDLGDKTFTLAKLYNYLDEIAKELSNMVITIAKDYSLDMPVVAYGNGNKGNQSISVE